MSFITGKKGTPNVAADIADLTAAIEADSVVAANAVHAASTHALTGATVNSSDATLLSRVNHTGTQLLNTISNAGTAASKNVPASGNAATTEVVLGSDTRLSASSSTLFINVKDYGAVGDGSTNDTTAIQNAFNAVPTSGGTVFIPAGTYQCSALLTHTTGPIRIMGAGVGISFLRFTTSSGGLSFTFPSIENTCVVDNLSLLTSVAGGGTALNLSWPTTSSGINNTCILYNLHIYPSTISTHYWTNGIVLTNAWNGLAYAVYFRGKTNTVSSSIAFSLLGGSTDCHFINCYVYFAGIALSVGGTCEGVVVNSCTFVYITTGISAVTTAKMPGTAIINTHINAFSICINFTNRVQTTIIGNLLFKRQDSNSNYVAVQLVASDLNHITGNMIRGVGTGGTSNGIVVISGDSNTITNNVFQDQTTAIWLQGGAGHCVVSNNHKSSGATHIINTGVSNILHSNYPVDAVTAFTTNSTTPDVGGAQSDLFDTANTVATTITNFLNGSIGQHISLLANDANTTIQHNVNMILRGGVSHTMANGEIMTLRKDATVWREESRQT